MAAWLEPAGIIGLIFGGCCSNVFALEAIVKHQPDSGLLITFSQFLLITLIVLPRQLSATQPYFLASTSVPLQKWALIAFMFFAINMLNNWAFAFNISVPVHIILRSFGSVTTMLAGWLKGKRYSAIQVASVGALTVGVIVAAWADAETKGKNLSTTSSPSPFGMGLLILLAAQLLSAYMGIYVEDTYAHYGRHWRETLFYSHFLSLPCFLPLYPTLRRQHVRLQNTSPLKLPQRVTDTSFQGLPLAPVFDSLLASLTHLVEDRPSGLVFLMVNALTQLLCISGVNLLSAKTSAVTVTIVLNVRKLVSFVFSVLLFGNPMSGKMVAGAAIVFLAGGVYGWESSVGIPRRKARMRELEGRKESKEGGDEREMNGVGINFGGRKREKAGNRITGDETDAKSK